jgi:O-antigen/teichoic acid export membrane protein
VRRALVAYGFPLTLTYLLDFIVSTSDRLLLGAFRSAEAAGTYGAAYDLCQQSLWTLMMILTLSAYPIIVNAFESRGIAGAQEQLRRHGVFLAAIAAPVATGLAVLAPNITGVIFPPSFASEARAVVPLIAFAVFLGGCKSYYLDLSFQLGQRTRRQLAAVSLAATANLVLNLLWIPRFGVLGAAWSTLIAYAVALVASGVLGRSVIALPIPWTELQKIVAASFLMGAMLWPLRNLSGMVALASQIVLGMLGYAVLSLFMDLGGVRHALAQSRWGEALRAKR